MKLYFIPAITFLSHSDVRVVAAATQSPTRTVITHAYSALHVRLRMHLSPGFVANM